jgi:dihydroflavonol-4-reductase
MSDSKVKSSSSSKKTMLTIEDLSKKSPKSSKAKKGSQKSKTNSIKSTASTASKTQSSDGKATKSTKSTKTSTTKTTSKNSPTAKKSTKNKVVQDNTKTSKKSKNVSKASKVKRAVVTGGSGFLGVHLCQALLKRGYHVVSLQRKVSTTLSELGVEQQSVDVLDLDAFIEACKGADELYHLAGFVSRDPLQASRMYELHLKGTQNFIQVVETLALKDAMLLSTSGVVAVSKKPHLAQEDQKVPWSLIGQWPYYESKAFAEAEVMRACERGLAIKVARPALFLGPGDPYGDSHGDILLFLSGDVKAALPGGLCAVDVRDVADFLPDLMRKGEPGIGYLIGAENILVRTFLNQIAQITGVKAPLLDLPLSWVDKAAGPLKWISKQKVFGGIDEQTFEMGSHFWYLDASRAEELGFQSRPLSQTLLDALQDLEQRGFFVSQH